MTDPELHSNSLLLSKNPGRPYAMNNTTSSVNGEDLKKFGQ